MTRDQPDIGEAVARFHEDVPHQFQVSLTMSMETRDSVSAVRDALNDAAGEQVLTTNDVIRLALVAAARYHAFATGEAVEPDAVDREQLVPLTAAIRRTFEDDRIPDLPDEKSD